MGIEELAHGVCNKKNRAWSTCSRNLKTFIRGQEEASKRLRRKRNMQVSKKSRKELFQKRGMILNKNCWCIKPEDWNLSVNLRHIIEEECTPDFSGLRSPQKASRWRRKRPIVHSAYRGEKKRYTAAPRWEREINTALLLFFLDEKYLCSLNINER